MHPTTARRFLYFLLITLLVNAGGWTFNREAVADVLFGAQETAAAAEWQHAPATSHFPGEPIKAKTPCNHWCHADGHLGLFGLALTLSSKPIESDFSPISRVMLEPVPEDFFRPPRFLS